MQRGRRCEDVMWTFWPKYEFSKLDVRTLWTQVVLKRHWCPQMLMHDVRIPIVIDFLFAWQWFLNHSRTMYSHEGGGGRTPPIQHLISTRVLSKVFAWHAPSWFDCLLLRVRKNKKKEIKIREKGKWNNVLERRRRRRMKPTTTIHGVSWQHIHYLMWVEFTRWIKCSLGEHTSVYELLQARGLRPPGRHSTIPHNPPVAHV